MNSKLERLLEIMALLRHPEKGCPWDLEQSFASIAPHTIEEAYEVADVIRRGDLAALKDELGDLLLQVVFHAQIADEAGLFDFEGVAGAICAKLIRRHPHVFGDDRVDGAEAQTRAWEEHKARERQAKSVAAGGQGGALDGIAIALPALVRAQKMQMRAARAGFDWRQAAEVFAIFDEEVAELKQEIAAPPQGAADRGRIEDEIGDLLFTGVNLARKLGLDAETALRRANGKFEERFRRMETMAAADERTLAELSFEEKEALWNRSKRAG